MHYGKVVTLGVKAIIKLSTLENDFSANFHRKHEIFCSTDNVRSVRDKYDVCLWHLRHWLQFWQLRTWIYDNLCYLTINCDTGQHSQFLLCFNTRLKFLTLALQIWPENISTNNAQTNSTHMYLPNLPFVSTMDKQGLTRLQLCWWQWWLKNRVKAVPSQLEENQKREEKSPLRWKMFSAAQ